MRGRNTGENKKTLAIFSAVSKLRTSWYCGGVSVIKLARHTRHLRWLSLRTKQSTSGTVTKSVRGRIRAPKQTGTCRLGLSGRAEKTRRLRCSSTRLGRAAKQGRSERALGLLCRPCGLTEQRSGRLLLRSSRGLSKQGRGRRLRPSWLRRAAEQGRALGLLSSASGLSEQ